MLEAYRALAAERPGNWGGELGLGLEHAQPYGRWLGNRLLAAAFSGDLDDWPATVRACLTDPLPAGLVVASLDGGGIGLRAGPVPYVLEGGAAEVAVLLDSHLEEATRVEVGGTPVRVGAGGVELAVRTVTGTGPLPVGGAGAPAGEPAARARLRLRARGPSRWSVVDDRGGAWFPEGRLPKWDFHDRPLFHGHDLELEVPAVPLTVTCARGMEFATAEATLTPRAGATTEVELEPERLYETAARGWYGGDLHVHMNYSGDLVCGPDDAACMQLGEGLHLMSLVAGNLGQTRVYDREAFEATVGRRPSLDDGRAGGPLRRRVPQRPARPFPRPRPQRPAGPLPQRPRGVGRAVRLAGQRDRLPGVPGAGGHRRLHPPGVLAPGRRLARRGVRLSPLGRGPRAGRRRRPGAGRLGRPDRPQRRRGHGRPLPPPAQLRAAAGRDRRHRRVALLLPGPAVLQPAGVGAGLRRPAGPAPLGRRLRRRHPGRAHAGHQRALGGAGGRRPRAGRPGPGRPRAGGWR